MEAPESALVPGSTLDRYQLLCALAQGGMATVWLARMHGKRGFEKLVAVKTIKAELVDDPRFEEMFLDEARIASGITHPNVAQITDLGEREGVLYLVMEWVDGESLAKVRKFAAKAKTRVPIGLALRIIADACAGLHAAHELKDAEGRPLGVVHRDVSPQNILVSAAGAVKIIDFGVAKAQNRLGTRTRTGVVKGKVQYMAPEQARGTPHDRRVDIWALGVCLYELLCDRLPFDGDNPLEVLSHITSDEPPPVDAGVPAPARNVVMKALARNPEDRFPTAAAMRRALESALTQLDEPSTSEDVAAFIEANMPERATQRQDIVARALKSADARGAPGPVDAYTGTVEVRRTAATRIDAADGGTPRPVPDSVPSQQLVPRGRGSTPRISARAIMESGEEAPRSRTLLWLVLAVLVAGGVAGFFSWRANPARAQALVARYLPYFAPAATPSPPPPETTSPPPDSAAPVPSASAAPSASANTIELPPTSSPVPSSSVPTVALSALPSSPRPPRHRSDGPPEPPRVRNDDWLPKESQLPVVQPRTPPPTPSASAENPY